MRFINYTVVAVFALMILVFACKDTAETIQLDSQVKIVFGGKIDPGNLATYANQAKPGYILQDNTLGGQGQSPRTGV